MRFLFPMIATGLLLHLFRNQINARFDGLCPNDGEGDFAECDERPARLLNPFHGSRL